MSLVNANQAERSSESVTLCTCEYRNEKSQIRSCLKKMFVCSNETDNIYSG